MRIDSHQHFWNYTAEAYPWIDPDSMSVLKRDFTPGDLASELDAAGLDASIAVQARQSLEESRWLLSLADQSKRIAGVVGWVDLRSKTVGEQLAPLAGHPKFVGVRHVVQDEPDDNFVLGNAFQEGISALKEHRLAYDILIYPKQLPAAIELVGQFPDQPFVLDHIAKPFIKDGTLGPWDQQIRQLARHDNVWCKVSGMVTEAAWGDWSPEDFKPYLDVIFEAFGVDRLMYGSDWPVCLLSGTYSEVHGLVREYVASLSQDQRDRFFGGNAAAFYRIK